MAIAFDASSKKAINNAASLTQAHTCSGSDRVLVVALSSADFDYMVSGTITYGGVSLGTPVLSLLGNPGQVIRLYVLPNPPAGTADIVVTPSQATYLNMVAASYTGVNQASPVSASNTFHDPYAISPQSTTIATPSGGVAVSALLQTGLTGALSCDASQTLVDISPDAFTRLGMSHKADAAAMVWTQTPGDKPTTQLVVSLSPVAGANTTPTFSGPNIGAQSGTEGVALSSNTVSDSFSDSDALTFSAIGTWPVGVTVSSGGVISGTPTTAGTYAALKVRATDTAAQTVDSDTFSFTIAAAGAGTITTPALKNNTGTVLASLSGWAVNVYHATTGALIVQKTGLTTSAGGVLTITDAAIVAGTTYAYEPVHATYGRRSPTGVAS